MTDPTVWDFSVEDDFIPNYKTYYFFSKMTI